MGKQVTLGGDRLGSGKRNKQQLNNFYRSNHNLSTARATSMAPGVLYPFYIRPCSNGDSFDMDINAFVRTIPTKGPLYGSFKLQVDFFQVPIRLYQGILHNNPLNIGLKMNQVKLPKIAVQTNYDKIVGNTPSVFTSQIHPSSLLKYCGVSGLGRPASGQNSIIYRKFNAIPILAYYDIFKNYYANKQEENAYIISAYTADEAARPTNLIYRKNNITFTQDTSNDTYVAKTSGAYSTEERNITFTIQGVGLMAAYNNNTIEYYSMPNEGYEKLKPFITNTTDNELTVTLPVSEVQLGEVGFLLLDIRFPYTERQINEDITLTPFKLTNIDDMRTTLLSMNQLGEEYFINDFGKLPYSCVCEIDGNSCNLCKYPHNGLVVKTYQSDMFNNWLDTEWIDGDNGINAITAVSTEDGSFTVDSLNLANKVYNMLNRIAISGGTYQDWQEAVYTDRTYKSHETPMYIGGMSSEIVFDEVVSTAASGNEELGTIAGRGNLAGRKGGHIKVNIAEPSFIMGIVSITPRLMYSQGNEFFMTDFDSVDDFHKPNLDGIGFQDLLVERMNFLGAICTPTSSAGRDTGLIHREAAGKQTAWLEYQTDVDRCYGDFALSEGAAFMVLNRNYDVKNGAPSDITTYIDPRKFNYAFADTRLASQNFWTFIKIDNKARLLMSAKQIPNL